VYPRKIIDNYEEAHVNNQNQATKQNQATILIAIGIMSIFSLGMALGTIQPAMGKIFTYYGDQGIPMTTVMYLVSLPQLITIVGGLIAGALAGKVLPFKVTGIIGILLFTLGGIAPYFIPGFPALMITRCVFGIGLGFLMILGNPLVAAYYNGDRKAKILSIGSFVSFGGALVMQLFGGVLADIDLKYVFLTHLLAVIPLILFVFLFKEPKKEPAMAQEKGEKGKLSGRVIFIAIILGLTSLCMMPLFFNYSVLVGKVSSLVTVASIVQVFYSIGTMLGGLSFMAFYKFSKRFSMGIYCIIAAIGMLIMVNVNNIPLMCIAMFIAGFGYGGLMPASLMITGLVTKPLQVAFATSIVINTMNVLGFLGTPFAGLVAKITGDAIVAPIVAGTIAIAIIGIFLLIVNPFPKKQREENFGESING
jgi:MFS family permease